MSVRISGTAAFALSFLLLAAASGRAQAPPPPPPPPQAPAPQPQAPAAPLPVTGFVSPYEIVHTVRSAGFDPLSPPLREGTTYVLRATDFRGILMRVVVDARTGAIRDVNRIVPGPGRYGELYGAPPPYDPADFDALVPAPSANDMVPQLVRPPAADPASPPLPRPRPAALASRKPADEAKPDAKAQPQPDPKSGTSGGTSGGTSAGTGADIVAKPSGASDAKPEINSEVITSAPAAVAPKKSAGRCSAAERLGRELINAPGRTTYERPLSPESDRQASQDRMSRWAMADMARLA